MFSSFVNKTKSIIKPELNLSLENVVIENRNLEQKHAYELERALTQSNLIKSLELINITFSDFETSIIIVNAIKLNQILKNLSISEMDLRNQTVVKAFSEGIIVNTSISFLKIHASNIAVENIFILFDAIKKNKSIKTLEINFQNSSPQVLSELILLLKENIYILDLKSDFNHEDLIRLLKRNHLFKNLHHTIMEIQNLLISTNIETFNSHYLTLLNQMSTLNHKITSDLNDETNIQSDFFTKLKVRLEVLTTCLEVVNESLLKYTKLKNTDAIESKREFSDLTYTIFQTKNHLLFDPKFNDIKDWMQKFLGYYIDFEIQKFSECKLKLLRRIEKLTIYDPDNISLYDDILKIQNEINQLPRGMIQVDFFKKHVIKAFEVYQFKLNNEIPKLTVISNGKINPDYKTNRYILEKQLDTQRLVSKFIEETFTHPLDEFNAVFDPLQRKIEAFDEYYEIVSPLLNLKEEIESHRYKLGLFGSGFLSRKKIPNTAELILNEINTTLARKTAIYVTWEQTTNRVAKLLENWNKNRGPWRAWRSYDTQAFISNLQSRYDLTHHHK